MRRKYKMFQVSTASEALEHVATWVESHNLDVRLHFPIAQEVKNGWVVYDDLRDSEGKLMRGTGFWLVDNLTGHITYYTSKPTLLNN